MKKDDEAQKDSIRQCRVRIARVEIVDKPSIPFVALQTPPADDPWPLLKEVAIQVQMAKNRFYAAFVEWHRKQGNDLLVREWMEQRTEAMAAGDKKVCKACPVNPFPADCVKFIGAEIRRFSPRLHCRSATLLVNREYRDLAKHKASKSAYKRWHRIIAGLGEQPSFSRPQPIPIDRGNAVRLFRVGERWAAEVRIDSIKRDGKCATSLLVRFHLDTGGGRKAARGARTKLEKILDGSWAIKGSAIVLDDGKWYLSISHTIPKAIRKDLDPRKTAVLFPARRKCAWRVRILGESRRGTFTIYPYGNLVGRVRRQVGEQRSTSAESYQYASTARKGHGRYRAMPRVKNAEDNFKKTANDTWTTRIVSFLADRGVGRLVFREPKEHVARTRFLITSGATERRPGQWPWYQVRTLLERKTEHVGMAFVSETAKKEEKKVRKSNHGKKKRKMRCARL